MSRLDSLEGVGVLSLGGGSELETLSICSASCSVVTSNVEGNQPSVRRYRGQGISTVIRALEADSGEGMSWVGREFDLTRD